MILSEIGCWPKEPRWPQDIEIPVNRDCFVYDFTKQTSLYLFETEVSHQSAVSISHHTILYLKQAIWIPIATFFFFQTAQEFA